MSSLPEALEETMKLLTALSVLVLLAVPAHADSVVNISTNDIVFSNGQGGTDTLALSMQEDVTTGAILSSSAEFTQGTLTGTELTVEGSGNSFSLIGGDIFMNFGIFDYSKAEYYNTVIGFPDPGVYSWGLFFNDNGYADGFASWAESGEVTVTDPQVPEPAEYTLLVGGIFGLIALKLHRMRRAA